MKVLIDIPAHILQSIDSKVTENRLARASYEPRQLTGRERAQAVRLVETGGNEAAQAYVASIMKLPPPVYRTSLLQELLEVGHKALYPEDKKSA